jgi:hypothetical protein
MLLSHMHNGLLKLNLHLNTIWDEAIDEFASSDLNSNNTSWRKLLLHHNPGTQTQKEAGRILSWGPLVTGGSGEHPTNCYDPLCLVCLMTWSVFSGHRALVQIFATATKNEQVTHAKANWLLMQKQYSKIFMAMLIFASFRRRIWTQRSCLGCPWMVW